MTINRAWLFFDTGTPYRWWQRLWAFILRRRFYYGIPPKAVIREATLSIYEEKK